MHNLSLECTKFASRNEVFCEFPVCGLYPPHRLAGRAEQAVNGISGGNIRRWKVEEETP
jgi:hypothetical protein